MTGTLSTGEEVDMWVRTTLGLKRVDGRWSMTHEHTSVPFGPDSYEARLNLQTSG